jgi:hypothetical protein
MTPCGRRPADVESDEMLRFVLVRGVEFIGEAASRVTRRGGPLHPSHEGFGVNGVFELHRVVLGVE